MAVLWQFDTGFCLLAVCDCSSVHLCYSTLYNHVYQEHGRSLGALPRLNHLDISLSCKINKIRILCKKQRVISSQAIMLSFL
ncbi:hypothetical protein GGR57DRAFT_454094 [Xylariaceae sp. FL1272]|nr:hypothetical protein GGR57DRAFT_454094 [Xylariaceae sp. FL1272]